MLHGRSLLAALMATAACTSTLPLNARAGSGWVADGLAVAPIDSLESDPVIAPDGAGGAFVAWQDYRGGLSTVYAQHLTSQGVPAPGWPLEGVPVTGGYAFDPMIVPDGRGGVFISATNGTFVGLRHLAADGTLAPPLGSAMLDEVAGAVPTSPLRGGSTAAPAAVEKTDPTALPVVIPDGTGGAFLTWEQGGFLRHTALVQRFTATGTVAAGWPSSGAPIDSSGWLGESAPVLCSDGAGGVIVAWLGYVGESLGIKGSRLSGDGALVPGWPGTGALVCGALGIQDAPGIVSDGSGGAIVVWQDARNGSYEQVYAQRITSSGEVAPDWPVDGRPVCTFPSDAGLTRYSGRSPQRYSSVASDGSGGALIVWRDARADSGDIFAQHLLPDGSAAPGWPADGLPLCTAPGVQRAPSIAADGAGGAFVTWQDGRSGGDWQVYAGHVTSSGTLAQGWAPDGVAACIAPGDHLIPRLAADGASGAIIAWQDVRCPNLQIFASHVAADGSLPTAPRVPVVSASVISSIADSGTVRVTWRVLNGTGALATVYSRQVDGPWMAVARLAPDTAGYVTYADRGAIAGCRYGYGVGLLSCGIERIFGEVWVDIPTVSASVVRSVADSGMVHLTWQVLNGAGIAATVYCRQVDGPWMAVARLTPDAAGYISYADRGAIAGCRYGYGLGFLSCGAERILGEVWVDIPSGAGFVPLTVSARSVQADSGRVHLTWQLVGSEGLPTTIFRRDSCSTWMRLGVLAADDDGWVAFDDRYLFEGHPQWYRLLVHACGQDLDLGEIRTDVPEGRGFIPTMATLESETVDSSGVLLIWRVVTGPPSVAKVYRQESTGGWAVRDVVSPDAAGLLRYHDGGLLPGLRYQYQLGLWNCGVERFFGPAVVEIPARSPPRLPRPDLALRGARPNPADRGLTVMFTLAGADQATLELFDPVGRRVMSRDVGSLGPGDHAVALGDVSVLRPGLYLIRLSQGGRSRSVRATVIR